MLKIARPVSLMLLSVALCSGGAYASGHTAIPKVDISQQQKSLKGTVNDDFGPVAGASVVVKVRRTEQLPIWTVILFWTSETEM